MRRCWTNEAQVTRVDELIVTRFDAAATRQPLERAIDNGVVRSLMFDRAFVQILPDSYSVRTLLCPPITLSSCPSSAGLCGLVPRF